MDSWCPEITLNDPKWLKMPQNDRQKSENDKKDGKRPKIDSFGSFDSYQRCPKMT